MNSNQSKLLQAASDAADEAVIQLAEVERECQCNIETAKARVRLAQSKLSAVILAINSQP